jgi:histone acetyltransferase (RNA polymerase elongator complex component)
MPWGAQTRADVLDEELASALREAGCVQLDLGVESGSDAALRRMAKGITVAQTRRAVALCRSQGLRVFANVMFNTPGETEEDVRLTRRLMDELRADHYGVLLTVPVPGTRIFADRFPDGLATGEYRLYACSEPYTRIVDPRFRLAAHDLDLDRLYVAVSVRHYLGNNLRFLSLRGWYLRLLARSRRRGAYAATWVSSFLRLTLRSVRKLLRLTLRGAGLAPRAAGG